MKKKLAMTMLALAVVGGFGNAADPVKWSYHFGPSLQSLPPATTKVVIDPSQTRTELGNLAPTVHEFSGVLYNPTSKAHTVALYQANVDGVCRVQVGLPGAASIAPGQTLEFKVRFDGHGMANEEFRIPVIFKVDGDEKQSLSLELHGNVVAANGKVFPQRVALTTVGDGVKTFKRATTRFEMESPDGQKYDKVEFEDARAPLKVPVTTSGPGSISGQIVLDPKGLDPQGQPAAKRGETRLLFYRNGVVMDSIWVQWHFE